MSHDAACTDLQQLDQSCGTGFLYTWWFSDHMCFLFQYGAFAFAFW